MIKWFAILLFSVLFTSCGFGTNEFDDRCQRGWPAYHEASRLVHDKLSKIAILDYIALKLGNSRGNYSFYILGLGVDKALFMHASEQEIRMAEVELEKAKRFLADVAGRTDDLVGYRGRRDSFSHLICEYLQIKSGGNTTTASFSNHILPSTSDPEELDSLDILFTVTQEFYRLMEDDPMVQFVRTAPPDLADPSDLDDIRKTKEDIFYEIPE